MTEVAGVLAALTIPITRSPGAPDDAQSPLHRLEHALAGPVAFVVVPAFGFANAGVSLTGMSPAILLGPLPSLERLNSLWYRQKVNTCASHPCS